MAAAVQFGQHPQRLDLYIHPGDPIDLGVPVLNAAGVAQTLSGWSAAATVTAPDGTLLHTFTPTVETTDDGDRIRVTADPEVTAGWAWSVYAARLTVTATPPGDSSAPLVSGWVRLYR